MRDWAGIDCSPDPAAAPDPDLASAAFSDGWLRRTLTGIIFALGAVWLTYPQLEEGFTENHLSGKTIPKK